jgi:hypothetical protein
VQKLDLYGVAAQILKRRFVELHDLRAILLQDMAWAAECRANFGGHE